MCIKRVNNELSGRIKWFKCSLKLIVILFVLYWIGVRLKNMKTSALFKQGAKSAYRYCLKNRVSVDQVRNQSKPQQALQREFYLEASSKPAIYTSIKVKGCFSHTIHSLDNFT